MQVKILQWNIWYLEDPRRIVEEIEGINPDIACIQEIGYGFHSNVDIPQLIASSMGGVDYYYEQAQSWSEGDGTRSQGNAIFSKLQVKDKCHLDLQPNIPNTTDFSQEGRNYVEVTIGVNGTSLTVGTTHLSYTHQFKETEQKDKQVAILDNAVAARSERYILTGDFNTPPQSSYVMRFLRHLKNAGPSYDANTWTTKPFKEGDFEEN